jgi:hypothetical protein
LTVSIIWLSPRCDHSGLLARRCDRPSTASEGRNNLVECPILSTRSLG